MLWGSHINESLAGQLYIDMGMLFCANGPSHRRTIAKSETAFRQLLAGYAQAQENPENKKVGQKTEREGERERGKGGAGKGSIQVAQKAQLLGQSEVTV